MRFKVTRKEFLNIYAGIRYWESQLCIEKVTAIQRMLFEAVSLTLELKAALAEGAPVNETQELENQAALHLAQAQALVFMPDIDDVPAPDSFVTPDDIAPFLPKETPKDNDDVTSDDRLNLAMDMFVYALLLNDPDDIELASNAIRDARKTIHQKDASPRLLACIAFSLFQHGHTQKALSTFVESLNKEPDRAETYLLRALMYFSVGQLDLALPDIERAEMLKKGDIFIMSLHGDIVFETRDIETAKQLHQAVLNKCPTLRRSLLSLAVIYLETGEAVKAHPHLCVLLRNEPLNWFALSCLGDIFLSQTGHTFKAIAFYTLSIIAGSTEPLVQINLIKLLIYSGRYAEALSLLDELFPLKKASAGAKSPRRFKNSGTPGKYAQELNHLRLTCELIVEHDKFLEDPSLLKFKLNLINADPVIAHLANVLLDYASLDYSDSMLDIAKRSVSGIQTLKAYIGNSSSRYATTGEVVMISAVSRMAIWNGFCAEARSFLRLLHQSTEPVILDTCDQLENELFQYESMARQAQVNISLFHILAMGPEGDAIRERLERGLASSITLSPTWRSTLVNALGLRFNPDWHELLFHTQTNPIVHNIVRNLPEARFTKIAPRIIESIDHLSNRLDDTWEQVYPAISKILKKSHDLTERAPLHAAFVDYLRLWFENAKQDPTPRRPIKAYWSMLRLISQWKVMSPEELGIASWKAANDDHVDKNALTPANFTNFLRPRYFDDTSFSNNQSYRQSPVLEVSHESSEQFLLALSECYAFLHERALTDQPLTTSVDPDLTELFYRLIELLHGRATEKSFEFIHSDPERYNQAVEIFHSLTPDFNIPNFELTLASWKPAGAKYNILPREPFPKTPILVRLQTPPAYPVACDAIRLPIPGNLITWHDLRELFHNYAVWAIEEALERNDDDALLPLLDPEFSFTFYDFNNPHKALKTPHDMHVALEQCLSDCKRRKSDFRLVLFYGCGNIGIKFTEQFDRWSEAHASELLSDCQQLESCVYQVDIHSAFETRCRLQSILNRYPFLSRLYILEATAYASLKDRKQAIESLNKGLEWEDRLYHGVGWNPIHPDPQRPDRDAPFEPISNDPNSELPYKIWEDNFMDINHENDLSYFFSNWEHKFKMRTHRAPQLATMLHRESNFDKAGAFEFYRLFSLFIKEVKHIEDVFFKALCTPGLWDLREYMRFVIIKTDSNLCFEFHRQLAELLAQIYPHENDMLTAHFCSDNGFSLNALLHACKTLSTNNFSGTPNDAYSACELIGAALYDMGYITEACSFLETTLKNPAPSAQSLLTLGCAYIEDQKYKKALDCLKRGCELDRFNDRFYFNAALAYIELEDYQEAENCLRNGLEIARAPFDLGLQLLRVFVRTERIHEAVELAESLNTADHAAFCDAMNSIEFSQFISLKPIRSLLD